MTERVSNFPSTFASLFFKIHVLPIVGLSDVPPEAASLNPPPSTGVLTNGNLLCLPSVLIVCAINKALVQHNVEAYQVPRVAYCHNDDGPEWAWLLRAALCCVNCRPADGETISRTAHVWVAEPQAARSHPASSPRAHPTYLRGFGLSRLHPQQSAP